MDADVKGPPGPRRYDASARRARAAARRRAALDAARARFLADGFAATTMAAVARDAALSPESLYKWFGSKAGLLRAVWEHSLEGSGPTPAETRSDAGSRAASSGAEVVRNWASLAAEVGAISDPIHRLLEGASHADPEAAELYAEIEEGRARRMEHNAAHLAEGGYLREGVTVERARDVLLLYTTLYGRLVTEAGWTPDEFSAFVERGLTAHLLR